MDPHIIVPLILSILIYQEGGKDTCLNYGALWATATGQMSIVATQFSFVESC